MTIDFAVRRAELADVPGMARVIVESWRETYRGLMRDDVLDDPDFPHRREAYWTAALSDPKYAQNVAAVAVHDGSVVGVAMSGSSLDEADGPRQLYVLYVLARLHGSGAGAALLDAVLDPAEPAVLWVADPNPRAQAFYRRHGFAADGSTRVEEDVRSIRMVRARESDAAEATA